MTGQDSLDGPGFESLQEQEICLFSKAFRKVLRLTWFTVQWVMWALFFVVVVEVKAALPPSSNEVKRKLKCTSTPPYAFVGCRGTSSCSCIRYLPINKTTDIKMSSVVSTLY